MKNLKRIILLIETSRAFGRDLLYGIVRYSRLNGAWTFYREPRGLKSSIPHLKNWKADGIIMRDSVIKNELVNLKLPTIFALHDFARPQHMPAIVTDAKSISNLAAKHLANRGFKNFAFCGYDIFDWSNERKKEYSKSVNDLGFEVNVYKQKNHKTKTNWQSELNNMKKWLEDLPKPIGIMACNDDRAQQVLEVCKLLEIKVPEEVAVIGVDNDELLCELSDPPLTSVALNTKQGGFQAAMLLDQLMNGTKMEGQEIIVSGTHVIPRQSTDLLSVEDKEVAVALRFIREHAKNKLFVDDIVKQTCLGRRTLEKRFKNIVNRSIQNEIRRVRVEQISNLLLDTNLSISEITASFNFTGIEHISRYFKKETGLGLREFRRIYQKC